MVDIAAIGALLSSIKTATEITTFIRDADIHLLKAESKAKVADLVTALADIRMQTADLRDTILEKDQQIRELEAKLALRNRLQFDSPYYWLVGEDNQKDGPYCAHCKEKDDKLIHLLPSDPGEWSCSVCRNVCFDKDYKVPPRAPGMFEGWQ